MPKINKRVSMAFSTWTFIRPSSTRLTPSYFPIKISWISWKSKNIKKAGLFFSPMHVWSQGQWWSKVGTHRLHSWQCFVRNGCLIWQIRHFWWSSTLYSSWWWIFRWVGFWMFDGSEGNSDTSPSSMIESIGSFLLT